MRWFLCALALLLSACHTMPPWDGTREPIEAAFRDMWARYSDCRSGSGVIQTWQDAEQLNRAVRLMDDSSRAVHLLPPMLERALVVSPPRLAVDPRAMAASCTLSAGQVAHDAGLDRLAARLFRLVLLNFDGPRYTYYREQAFKGMAQLGNAGGEQILRIPVGQIH